MENKIFTIIIPVYQAEYFLERCLSSLISNKKFIKEVILVIDDQQEEKYRDITLNFNCFYDIQIIKNEENLGASQSRANGMRKAKSEWISCLDSDDCLTSNSLRYVWEIINTNPHIKLIHSQTIYYESGAFNKNDIRHSDYSFGGNFYNLNYLKENNIFPDGRLRRSEDEFFNEKLNIIINENSENNIIYHFDYPVYEVHHDYQDTGFGLALSDTLDYFSLSRFKYAQLLVEDLKEILPNDILKGRFIFIFYFAYLSAGICSQDIERFNAIEDSKRIKEAAKTALIFYKNFFNESSLEIYNYLNKNNQLVENVKQMCINSLGLPIYSLDDFCSFLKNMENYKNFKIEIDLTAFLDKDQIQDEYEKIKNEFNLILSSEDNRHYEITNFNFYEE